MKRVKSTAVPRAMNSAPQVDLATDFCRRDPQAMGQPKHVMMNPEVDLWNSPPQPASDQVVNGDVSGQSLSFLCFVDRT